MKKIKKCSYLILRVFIILTAFIFLLGCISQGGAPVSDQSKQSLYKGRIYTVQAGDTLYSIAWRHGVDVKKICEFNKIAPPYRIVPGQKLMLDPAPVGRESSRLSTKREAGPSGKNGVDKGAVIRSKQATDTNKNASKYLKNAGAVLWQWPSSGKVIAPFSSENLSNKGIDIGGKLGEPVLAAASGQVVYAGSGLSGYGKLLIIKHNETFLSAYAHNSELLVKEGEIVKVGQRIADMGSSGTDRVKLHFEIRSDGTPVNPLIYLPKR